jgi:hypothetical protein
MQWLAKNQIHKNTYKTATKLKKADESRGTIMVNMRDIIKNIKFIQKQ